MNEKKKILLVEDDLSFGSVLKDYLTLRDFEVHHSKNGEEGLEDFKQKEYDLCLLDVMMPKKDGFTLAKEIKAIRSDVPIIFLTAKGMREDMLQGYKLGADDYITKPFDSELLLYKIKAVLQRKYPDEKAEMDEFQILDYHFNFKLRLLTKDGVTHKLSPKENELLKMMCQNLNDITYRDEALRKIWKSDDYFSSRSMDVYIAKLRKYFKDDPRVEIANIHGEGFRLIIDSGE